MNYKKNVLIRCLLFLFSIFACINSAYSKNDITDTKYDIEGHEVGVNGTYLVKVTIYTKNGNATTEQFKYAAVHGVLFRGIKGKGFTSQKSIANPEIEEKKSDFFDAFFRNGDYLTYATVTKPNSDRIKISKKEYKISAIVSVSKDELRKSLEKAGIIKRLDSNF